MLGNLILETTNAPGTSADCLLAGAATGRLPFSSAFVSGAICFYVLNDGTQSEWGIGTYTAGSPNKLTRTTVLKNSAGTTARLNFLGSTRCYNDIPAEKSLWVDQNNTVTIPGNLAVAQLSVSRTAANGAALVYLSDPSAAADAKIFDFISSTGSLGGRAVNDAYTAANNWLTVGRSGYTITAITLAGTAIALNGTTVTLAGTTINLNANVVANASISATDFWAGNAFRLNASGAYIYSNASVTQFVQDSGNWRWEYNRGSGAMSYIRGYDAANLFSIDPGGNTTSYGRHTADSIMSNSGAFYVAGNTAYYTARSPSTGTWSWVEGGTANMTLDTSGGLITRQSVISNFVKGNSAVQASPDGSFQLYESGINRVVAYTNNWTWMWQTNNGQLSYFIPGGTQYLYSVADYISYNWLAAQAGVGAYITTSDEATKTEISEASHGLTEILALKPITFRRWHQAKGRFHERVELGFGARQVRDVLPHAVVEMDAPAEWRAKVPEGGPVYGVQSEAIVAALVNSCKELMALNTALAARVAALEGHPPPPEGTVP
jgi:hypothetical protein